MKLTIIVATHVRYKMPQDACYLPLQVGKAGKKPIGFQGDDTGDHISEKNPSYCELTGLYWMWKNVDSDYLGVVHYRRYLGKRQHLFRGRRSFFEDVLTEEEILNYMEQADILLPRRRKYYIENIYRHYAQTHYAEHLDRTREVLAELCPDYVEAFDTVMKRRSAHMFNIFVMSREKCDHYCSWLFAVLQELENRIDMSGYDAFQMRVFGRVSEMLLDVWLERNQFRYVEAPMVYTEKPNQIKKAAHFLMASFFGRKYTESV